jgi:uncharacterized membrane protein YkoI
MLITAIRRTAMAVAALAALSLGGSAIAGAADTTGSSSSNGTSPSTTQTRGRDHAPRQPLAAGVAAQVKAAALAKVPGATVLETESGGPDGSAYHAHIRTSDGKLEVVLVNASFAATAVQPDDGHGGRHGGHGHGAETPLTGATKSSVEAAVLAKYPGATIERTETNTDGSAPYESHIKTSAGTELEVHVSKDFAVTDAQQHPAHP